MLFKNKRGQAEASNAAVLVALIAGIVLLYILFLPPGERADLLDGANRTHDTSDENETGGNVTLLSESPGRIDYLAKKEFAHDLPSFTLFKTTGAQEIATINPFYVKNSWFDGKTKQISFKISDLENTDNVILTFTVQKYKGVLIIMLNGQNIFENEVSSVNLNPITLPKNTLKEDNVLDFSVSEVGWAFWSANQYSLQDVKVIGDVTDLSKQESTNVFYLSDSESYNLENVKLKFAPDCRQNQVGILEVIINYDVVFSGIPDCGTLNKIEFSPSILKSGNNKVIFKTETGSYLIDRITIETKLKELLYPTFYFDLDKEKYDDVKNGDKDLILHFQFVRADEDREMEVIVNGRKFSYDIQKGETYYSKDIGSYIQEEENYIKIVPKAVLEISKLKVTLG